MKILWIVNTVLDALSEHLYHKKGNGLWMEALLESFKNQTEHELVVATTVKTNKTVKIDKSGIRYYALPDQPPTLYDENKPENIAEWKRLLEEEQPDVIQVWGTEFTHGLCALRLATYIPSVIYMQGYLGSIARHYLAGITEHEWKKTVTFRDFIKSDSVLQQQKKYYISSEKEKEMLQLAGNVIIENQWCKMSIRAIAPNVNMYTCPLSVNEVFEKEIWNINDAEPHSVICTASGYPLKGLHMVLRAIALLKDKYSDIKLYIPGPQMVSGSTIQWKLRKRGYTKYIEKLVKELNLSEQIVWLGYISQEKLAEYYTKSRVFVLSSAIENHSSSLKEAMLVGIPSVASAVGGVPEYVQQGVNGFLYRFEEYEIMADYIMQIFEDDELALQLSKNGKVDMLKLHGKNDIYDQIQEIYKQVIKKGN